MKKYFIFFWIFSVVACGSPSNDKLEGSTSTAVGNPNLPAYSINEEKVVVKAITDGNVTIEAKNDFIELAPVLSMDNVETEFLVNGVLRAKMTGSEFLEGEILFKISVPANKGDIIRIHVRVPNTLKEDNHLEAIASEEDTYPQKLSGDTMAPITKIDQNPSTPPPAPVVQPLVEEYKQECSANVSCSDGLICYLFHCYSQEEYDSFMETQAHMNKDLTPQQSVQMLEETAAIINNPDNQLAQNKLDTQVPLPKSFQVYNNLSNKINSQDMKRDPQVCRGDNNCSEGKSCYLGSCYTVPELREILGAANR